MLLVIALIGALAVAPPNARCRVVSVVSGVSLVGRADAIVRARAAAVSNPAPGAPLRSAFSAQGITFEILEVLKGAGVPSELVVNGVPSEQDDFNPTPVPYS